MGKTIRMSMEDVYEQTGFCKPLTEEDNWLQGVIDSSGDECGNCGEWRILKRYLDGDPCSPYIEQCWNCGDEAYDIYETAECGP